MPGHSGMVILSLTPENQLLLMQNFNLGIAKMSVILENQVQCISESGTSENLCIMYAMGLTGVRKLK